jgi:hypothetical protein
MTTKGSPTIQARMRSEERKTRVEVAARNAGLTPSGLVNALLDWWMGEPGAELPNRPERTDGGEADIGRAH